MSTTSQVIVNVDTKLKNLAMKKAKGLGIPFSSVLKMAIKAFVEDHLNIGLVQDFNFRTRGEIKAALEDISRGKDLSPEFSSADKMLAHLRN